MVKLCMADPNENSPSHLIPTPAHGWLVKFLAKIDERAASWVKAERTSSWYLIPTPWHEWLALIDEREARVKAEQAGSSHLIPTPHADKLEKDGLPPVLRARR